MNKTYIIATNTFREIIRDRVLYGVIVFAVLLIGFSLALGGLSFSEQGRIALNFGLAGIQLASCTLAVFVGSTLVSKEIEKQTILTILSRPITRSQFVIGKFIGLFGILGVLLVGLSLILIFVSVFLNANLGWPLVIALFGITLEALVLLSLTMFLGVMVRPMLTVTCSIAFFLIGHWVSTLSYFIEKSESSSFKILGKIIMTVVPNLEKFNWRAQVTYQELVVFDLILSASLYALGWILVLLSLTNLIFRRRDFV